MKNIERWRPTKFFFKENKLVADVAYVGTGSKHIGDLVAATYQKYIPDNAKGDLLDLGYGTVPFYELYKPYVNSVACADWETSLHDLSHIDFAVDLNGQIAIPENSYDTIILSDVLEHIYEPRNLLKQLYSVLRKDGKIILNVPFAYWEHEAPHDYYRYTRFFFEKIAADLGYTIVVIEQIGPEAFNVVVDIAAKLKRSYKNKLRYKLFHWMVTMFFRTLKSDNLNFPLGYFVVLSKETVAK